MPELKPTNSSPGGARPIVALITAAIIAAATGLSSSGWSSFDVQSAGLLGVIWLFTTILILWADWQGAHLLSLVFALALGFSASVLLVATNWEPAEVPVLEPMVFDTALGVRDPSPPIKATFAFLSESRPDAQDHLSPMLNGVTQAVAAIDSAGGVPGRQQEVDFGAMETWTIGVVTSPNGSVSLDATTTTRIANQWCGAGHVVFAVGLVQSSSAQAFMQGWSEACPDSPIPTFTVGPTSTELDPTGAYPHLRLAPSNAEQATAIVHLIGASFPWEAAWGQPERSPCRVYVAAQRDTGVYWESIVDALVEDSTNARRGRCALPAGRHDVTVLGDWEGPNEDTVGRQELRQQLSAATEDVVLVVVGMAPFAEWLLEVFPPSQSESDPARLFIVTDGAVTADFAATSRPHCVAGAFPAGDRNRTSMRTISAFPTLSVDRARPSDTPDFFFTAADAVTVGYHLVRGLAPNAPTNRAALARRLEQFLEHPRGALRGGGRRTLPVVTGVVRFPELGQLQEIREDVQGGAALRELYHIHQLPPGSTAWQHRQRSDGILPYCTT